MCSLGHREYIGLFSCYTIYMLNYFVPISCATMQSCYSIKLLFRTADLMYAIPFYRATIYLLGILLGYVLHTCKDYRLSEVSTTIVCSLDDNYRRCNVRFMRIRYCTVM